MDLMPTEPTPSRPVATNHDLSRQVATALDTDFVLTIEEVANLYAKAGHPRTTRSLQRYCAKGHLESQRKETTLGGEIYLVSPQSVARHIAQIEELSWSDMVASGRDKSRQVATAVAPQLGGEKRVETPTTDNDTQRQSATGGEVSRYVEQLEKRIEEKDEVIGMLRGELAHRNEEIVRRNERERETNVLIRGSRWPR